MHARNIAAAFRGWRRRIKDGWILSIRVILLLTRGETKDDRSTWRINLKKKEGKRKEEARVPLRS